MNNFTRKRENLWFVTFGSTKKDNIIPMHGHYIVAKNMVQARIDAPKIVYRLGTEKEYEKERENISEIKLIGQIEYLIYKKENNNE